MHNTEKKSKGFTEHLSPKPHSPELLKKKVWSLHFSSSWTNPDCAVPKDPLVSVKPLDEGTILLGWTDGESVKTFCSSFCWTAEKEAKFLSAQVRMFWARLIRAGAPGSSLMVYVCHGGDVVYQNLKMMSIYSVLEGLKNFHHSSQFFPIWCVLLLYFPLSFS